MSCYNGYKYGYWCLEHAMANTRQLTFEEIEYRSGRERRQTRKARKLEVLDKTTPWEDLVAIVEPFRPKAGGRGRQPWPTETLLRMYFVQVWLNLSDEATEDECYDSRAVRDFVGCYDGVPDATTLANFRHLVEDNDIDVLCFDAVVERLDQAGLISHGGTVIDSTIIESTKSTKNESGERDPEMHQTKKGKNWHHGMKIHTGEDALGGYVHTVTFTPANTSDISETHNLVRDDDEFCNVDAGYQGIQKRPEIRASEHLSGVDFRVAMRPGKLKEKRKLGDVVWADLHEENRKASTRARAEHPYNYLKGTFGYGKTRYRGIRKNAARIRMVLASTNVMMVGRAGRTEEFLSPDSGSVVGKVMSKDGRKAA